ncbi:MAG: hypothetical protein KGL75_09790 [Acidobacteriota bacterium]|nr:hypothetical protein [Acidobacteriota bacterium]
MRRVPSMIVILALLAVPVALVARTGPCARSDCDQMCGLVLRSVRAGLHGHCVCGMNRGTGECPTPSQKLPDYGLNAPIAPTMLSARLTIARPIPTLRAAESTADFVSSGFISDVFEPPRV